MNQNRVHSVPVDLIRTIAIVGIIFLHATNDLTPQQMNQFEIFRWVTVDVYQSFARMAVPLFVMLTGALLLQPSKDEGLRVFFKKRWARLGMPFLFWSAAYFVWLYIADHQALTPSFIIQGMLTGPYDQFWYIYMLVGLYLLTPILRIVIADAKSSVVMYFVVLWVLGAGIMPFVGYFSGYNLDSNVFTLTGFVGYYILGIYLLKVKIRRSILLVLTSIGVTLVAVGTYVMAATVGGAQIYYFQEYLSPTMILASVMFFLFLNTVNMPSYKPMVRQPPPAPKEPAQREPIHRGVKPTRTVRLLRVISENTLPIFFFHLIVLFALQRGYFGFAINGASINSIVGVPLITLIALFICLAVIVPLKKVPVLKKLIG